MIIFGMTVDDARLTAAANTARDQSQPLLIVLPSLSQSEDPSHTEDGRPITRIARLCVDDQQLDSLLGVDIQVRGPQGTTMLLTHDQTEANTLTGEGLELEMYDLNPASVQASLEEGGEAVFAQEITANVHGPTALLFVIPEGLEEAGLRIKVNHTDGSTEDIVPKVVVMGGVNYLQATVDKWSTLIIYRPAKEESVSEIILTIGELEAMVSGELRELDAAPYLDLTAGRTMVPLRFISETLQGQVTWLRESNQVRIVDGQNEILLTIGETAVLVNGKAATIDAPAVLSPQGRTFVPLRFVSETIGADVAWRGETKQVVIRR